MKPAIALILSLILLTICAACGVQPAPTATPTPAATLTAVETPTPLTPDTLTPAPTLSPSATPQPTETPAPPTITPTRTITPLPTIPTFTPTFDARTIVTATPAPKAECPKPNPDLPIDSPIYLAPWDPTDAVLKTMDSFLQFLNNGGKVETVVEILKKHFADNAYKDVTGDGIPDLITRSGYDWEHIQIFYCENGTYKTYSFPPEIQSEKFPNEDLSILGVRDMNLDGISEIAIKGFGKGYGWGAILRWNGVGFENLLQDAKIWGITYSQDYEVMKDVDNNKLFEIILRGGYTEQRFGVLDPTPPARVKSLTYGWNGKNFVLLSTNFTPPTFRFQAVQDADQDVLAGDFRSALSLYKSAIFDKGLNSWPPEKAAQNYYVEYDQLAAYSFFRVMILHIYRGNMADAQTTFNDIQRRYGLGSPGHPYAEMATTFWDAWQSTHKMYDGCAAAIGYAAAHPEILTPLGSDYHGAQSHLYVPADVCPFR